jgi:hypothetical protein
MGSQRLAQDTGKSFISHGPIVLDKVEIGIEWDGVGFQSNA